MLLKEYKCSTEQEKTIKSLLKSYRKVLHNVNNNLVYLDDETFVNSRKHLSDLVNGLVIFETQAEENRFYDRVSSYYHSLELLKLLEKVVLMVKDYPGNGKLYYEILQRLYFDNFKYNNEEIMEILRIPRSSYYRYLKQAYSCFRFHFIGILHYENKHGSCISPDDDFYSVS